MIRVSIVPVNDINSNAHASLYGHSKIIQDVTGCSFVVWTAKADHLVLNHFVNGNPREAFGYRFHVAVWKQMKFLCAIHLKFNLFILEIIHCPLHMNTLWNRSQYFSNLLRILSINFLCFIFVAFR